MFVRGAYSIDKAHRTEGLSWWKEEELNYKETEEFLSLYEVVKPEIVISHDGPINAMTAMYGYSNTLKSWTSSFLYEAYKIYAPKQWYFGHHHQKWEKKVGATNFRCLNIDEYLDIEI